jgi:hypothetical protein
LVNNVKIILTVSSASANLDDFDSPFLRALKAKVSAQNFLFLSSFTQEQWEDVLANGSGAIQLPEAWKKADEKVPIQAKVREERQRCATLYTEIVFFFADPLVACLARTAKARKLINFSHKRKSL